jgi:hypothetical protein
MKPKKLYKSVLKIEVLSEEPLDENIDMESILYKTQFGDYSGRKTWESGNIEVVGVEAVKECDLHGTDPEFFQMDEQGFELEDF